jgi:4-hydroxy-tetrahydrodipicolinate synthase
MAAEPMRGVYPIIQTPFDEQDRVDEESLRRLAEYIIEHGVHGIGIAFGSEIPKLTEAERTAITAAVIDQSRGRVPVVVNTGAPSNFAAVEYSRQAEAQGADAVMSLPPETTAEGKRAYFRAISEAIGIPIFAQEAGPALGAALLRQVAEESEQVRYAKIESGPPITIHDAVQQCGDLVTVFGGASGTHLIEELRRGSQGTMPWASQPQAFVRVWNHWEAGEEDEAHRVWEREISPVLRLGGVVHKEILHRQGVIACARFRSPGPPPLDDVTQGEFDALCERLGIGSGRGANRGG